MNNWNKCLPSEPLLQSLMQIEICKVWLHYVLKGLACTARRNYLLVWGITDGTRKNPYTCPDTYFSFHQPSLEYALCSVGIWSLCVTSFVVEHHVCDLVHGIPSRYRVYIGTSYGIRGLELGKEFEITFHYMKSIRKQSKQYKVRGLSVCILDNTCQCPSPRS